MILGDDFTSIIIVSKEGASYLTEILNFKIEINLTCNLFIE